MHKIILILFLLMAPLSLLAQLNKGYGELEKGNFTEAKTNLFKNRLGTKPGSKDLQEAYFGLFCYYGTEANPENNPDKAWLYLDSTSVAFREEFKVKYKPFENQKVTHTLIDTLKAHTELSAYKRAETANTVATWKQYIAFYTKSNNAALLKKAQSGLEQKAFDDQAKANNLAGLEAFVAEYKTAPQVDSATAMIDRLRWKNTLATNTREGYASFIKNFPTNKKLAKANDSLSSIDYRITSKAATTGAFKAYLATYPDSKYKPAALNRICLIAYDSVVTAAKEAGLKSFVADYSGCPQVGIIRDKLDRMECEKCLAAPTKDCLALVMKNCGSDNAIALRVNAALMAMVDKNAASIDCEKCLANPTKDCLIQLYKNCGADSGLVKRANDVFMTVMNRERDKLISDSLARMKKPAIKAPEPVKAPAVMPVPATVDKPASVPDSTRTNKTDTTHAVKPDVDDAEDVEPME